MESKKLGRYFITYTDNKISQHKDLISHEDFENIVKPKKTLIFELEQEKLLKKIGKEFSLLKKILYYQIGLIQKKQINWILEMYFEKKLKKIIRFLKPSLI